MVAISAVSQIAPRGASNLELVTLALATASLHKFLIGRRALVHSLLSVLSGSRQNRVTGRPVWVSGIPSLIDPL